MTTRVREQSRVSVSALNTLNEYRLLIQEAGDILKLSGRGNVSLVG